MNSMVKVQKKNISRDFTLIRKMEGQRFES